jgi:hypothetical protein
VSTQGFGSWPNRPGHENIWYLADGSDGWYVISPDGGECGPFTEDEAGAKKRELMEHAAQGLGYDAAGNLIGGRSPSLQEPQT